MNEWVDGTCYLDSINHGLVELVVWFLNRMKWMKNNKKIRAAAAGAVSWQGETQMRLNWHQDHEAVLVLVLLVAYGLCLT